MISDDDLLLYHYRDGLDADERARIGAALSEQPALAQRLQTLVARLDAVGAMPEVPVPLQTQQRWQAALERAQRGEAANDARATPPRRRFFMDVRWQAAAAAVVVVALGVIVQTALQKPADQAAAVNPSVTPAATTDASAYERGLKVHLASTERQIAELDRATPEERARLIATIVAQNRIYALAAERAGEPQLARVLRAFAPVLESLAKDGGDSTASIAQLGFELRVMQGRLNAGASSGQTTTL